MVRGRDKIFTKGDYENLRSDLLARQETAAMSLVPIKQFWKTDSTTFGEPGPNLSVQFLYLPFATLFLLVFKSFRRRVGAGFVYLNIAVVSLLVNWLAFPPLARYCLHLFPVYLGYLGICFNLAILYVQLLVVKKRVLGLAFQTSLLLLILALPVPSPTSKQYYGANLKRNYLDLSKRLTSKDGFLRTYLPGYVSTQTIINSMYTNGGQQHQRVLAVGFENLSFYFRERSIVNVGDWFGPGRYADLMSAVDNSDLAAYLSRFEIGAVMVNLAGNPMSEEQCQSFIKQLELNNFKLQPEVETRTAVYLKTN